METATGPPPPQLPPEAFAKRRAALAATLDGPLVVATNPQTTYSNDVENPFRPSSDFWYLTGFAEPDSVLVLEPEGTSTLFLRQREPAAEVWHGRRLGVERADTLGVDRAYAVDEFPERLPALLAGRQAWVAADRQPEIAARVKGEDGSHHVAALRCIKDAAEVKMMQQAADIGAAAMEAALEVAKPGAREYVVEAELLAAYRRAGTRPGYPPIVGAGANAGILHYIENQDVMHEGDFLLIDAGCEWGYYNSDITRTAILGTPQRWQQEMYDIVAAAQQAGIAAVKPGVRLREVHDAAVRVLVEGLVEMDWLEGEPDKLMESQAHRGFYMHGTSHFLGLDVHDVGSAKEPDGTSRILKPGMVITVEPGLYLNPDFNPLPAGVRPGGVRIENDVLVTEDGHHDFTRDLSTTLAKST